MLLSRDPNKRPRVHDILAMPLIKGRIREFLTRTQHNVEFGHTIIHKKDLNQIYQEEALVRNKLAYKDSEDRKSDRDSQPRDEKKTISTESSERPRSKPEPVVVQKPSSKNPEMDPNKYKLQDIDIKLDQLRLERENRKKELEEKRKQREEERQRFLTELKKKSLNDKKSKNDIEVYWTDKNSDQSSDLSSRDFKSVNSMENMNYVVEKSNPTSYKPIQEEDEEENPCGINEGEVNQED